MEVSAKVSVLMSVYVKEKPEYLQAALESIVTQTYQVNEIMLIEDGPLTEQLYDVIHAYQEKYPEIIKRFAFEKNQQLGRALAKGVELCSNELVARMDTDDIAMPDRIEKQAAYMHAHPEVHVLGGAIREFNDEGTTDRVKLMPKTQEEIREYVKIRNPLNHMTVMFRRSAILEAGNYKHFPFLEDYSLWSRMLAKGYQIRNVDDILVRARTSMALVKRRSGWAYYKDFSKLRKFQYELGLLNNFEYIKTSIGTFVVLMLPGSLKALLYKILLRK